MRGCYTNVASRVSETVMATVRIVSLAGNAGSRRHYGGSRARLERFDSYAKALVEHPDAAVIFEDLGENTCSFMLSLRKALKQARVSAGVRATPRKGRVLVWLRARADGAMSENAALTRQPRQSRRAFTREDPLFGLIGIGEGKTPGGVSGRKHEALTRAYRPR